MNSPSFSALFSLPMVLFRNNKPNSDKVKYSKEVPSWFDEIMCGLMVGDGSVRMHGRHALLPKGRVQQIHKELVVKLWEICFSLHLVLNPVKPLNRSLPFGRANYLSFSNFNYALFYSSLVNLVSRC
jgi:hypothetical protein